MKAQGRPLSAIAEAVRREGRPEGAGGLTIVVWIPHHTDRKERVVTQTRGEGESYSDVILRLAAGR